MHAQVPQSGHWHVGQSWKAGTRPHSWQVGLPGRSIMRKKRLRCSSAMHWLASTMRKPSGGGSRIVKVGAGGVVDLVVAKVEAKLNASTRLRFKERLRSSEVVLGVRLSARSAGGAVGCGASIGCAVHGVVDL